MSETASVEEIALIRMSREFGDRHGFARLANGRCATGSMIRFVPRKGV